jgi:hypothetical protein
MTSFSTEFDTPPIFEQELDEQFESFDSSADDVPDPVTSLPRSPGEEARRLILNKERYKESAAQRTASLAYASLEQAEATDRMTAMLERQVEALERQNALTERRFTEERMHNQLLFYSMSPTDFVTRREPAPAARADGSTPADSVYTQIKRNLGIQGPRPKAEVAANTEIPPRPYTDVLDDSGEDFV